MPTYTTSAEFQDTPEGRKRRQKWVDEHHVEVSASTKATLNDVEEAENTFVDAYYLGSFAVSVVTIEQILHEQLPENRGSQWSLGDIIERSHSGEIIDSELQSSLLDLKSLRRSKFHYRGKRDPAGMEGHIFQRMDEEGKSPVDIRGSDAKEALRCLYEVERIAKVDIDSDKLPG